MSKSANPNKRRTRGPITRTQIVVIPESTRIIKSKNRRKENNLLPDGSCRAVDLRSGLLGISVAFAKLSGCACPSGHHHHHHHTTTAVPVPSSQWPGFLFEFGNMADPNLGVQAGHQKRSWKAKHRLN